MGVCPIALLVDYLSGVFISLHAPSTLTVAWYSIPNRAQKLAISSCIGKTNNSINNSGSMPFFSMSFIFVVPFPFSR